ncbi:MAG TPA: hotdog domain-containing protein [Chthoniobacterales bacterium]|nr:hotdog domain-containing protein [Chthoniobacterales bacterium]
MQLNMTDADKPPEGEPRIRAITMPADANPYGDIFGGWLMSQMDLAAASAACRRCRGRCATVAVDGMIFHRPVFVGDEVSLYATIISRRPEFDDNPGRGVAAQPYGSRKKQSD